MLNKYLASPEVRLTIRPSKRRSLVLLVFTIAVVAALLQLLMSVYSIAAVVLVPLTLGLLYRARSDGMEGSTVIWREGQWFLVDGEQEFSASLMSGTVKLPQLIFFSLQGPHGLAAWRIFLFSDSADQEQLRLLRCRLTLSKHREEHK